MLAEKQPKGLQLSFKVEGLFVTIVGTPGWKKIGECLFQGLKPVFPLIHNAPRLKPLLNVKVPCRKSMAFVQQVPHQPYEDPSFESTTSNSDVAKLPLLLWPEAAEGLQDVWCTGTTVLRLPQPRPMADGDPVVCTQVKLLHPSLGTSEESESSEMHKTSLYPLRNLRTLLCF